LALELEAGEAPASFFVFVPGWVAGATVAGGAIGVGSGVGVGAGSATGAAETTSATTASSAGGFDRVTATITTTMPRSRNKPPNTPASITNWRLVAAAFGCGCAAFGGP
jgi:hypothetical protein